MVRMRGVTRIYEAGSVRIGALRGIDLDIDASEFVAIMGPSGSGKSTLMNIVGCLDLPDGGEYWLDGERVAGLGEDRLAELRNRKIGFVFQSFNLLARTTALRNVMLPLIYGAPGSSSEREARARRALAMVGMADRADHRPSELSGGQQQRAAIARALVTGPAVILADEPTGNLDTASSMEVMAVLQELHRGGATIIVVTHEADIGECAERIVRMRDGLIESDGAVPRRRDARAELNRLRQAVAPLAG